MELQIQELVTEQRCLKKDLEDIKAQINENFTELEYLRRVAHEAREKAFHHRPPALHDPLHPGQILGAVPPAAAPAAPLPQPIAVKKPPKQTGPPTNLGHGAPLIDPNFTETLSGHFNTLH